MSKVNKDKRYILFAGLTYYPSGGIEDLKGTYDTPAEAKAAFSGDWYEVVDRETLETVEVG